MKVEITQKNFGDLCICALRYCQGRQTYMPSVIQAICKEHLKDFSDKDIQVMLNDCNYQEHFNLYGDERIDKPGWVEWKKCLEVEQKTRKEMPQWV